MGSYDNPMSQRRRSIQVESLKLAASVYYKYSQLPSHQPPRILIAIAGIPGSGKTTLATALTTHLNKLHAQETGIVDWSFAVALSVDNFHASHVQRVVTSDTRTAIHRRDVASDLDASKLHAFVAALRRPLTPDTCTVLGPSFDDTVEGTVKNIVAVEPRSRIVVFEGNYCVLNRAPWRGIARLMDELWFVDVEHEAAKEELVGCRVQGGRDESSTTQAVNSLDSSNAEAILANAMVVDRLVRT